MEVIHDSVLLGAAVIEKHFTHDKTLPGNDHYHAMDKEDLKLFWQRWNRTQEWLGVFEVSALAAEEPARKMREEVWWLPKIFLSEKSLKKKILPGKDPLMASVQNS